MDHDTIIRLAREEGDVEADTRGRETFSFDSYGLERFAALVAAHEREACAKICDRYDKCRENCADVCADAIRSRT